MPNVHLPELPNFHNTITNIDKTAETLRNAKQPVIIINNQSLINIKNPKHVARALNILNTPVYLTKTARGLLNRTHELQLRHNRGAALKEADVVIVYEFPFDFRLDYNHGISKKTTLIATNLSSHELKKNQHPNITTEIHTKEFLIQLANKVSAPNNT